MIVMPKAALGSLRNNLLKYKYNPNDKFYILCCTLNQLESIHQLNLIHGDFHDGNLLCENHKLVIISDFGLCRPVNQSNNIKNDIYGVLPYMAPEVLRGKPYTKAADIYNFGIIMWEMTSGIPAFHDIPHDFHLSLNICKGIRPEIIEGTMPEYVGLMKRCWDNDPEKRPTASELLNIFWKWQKMYPIEKDEKKRIPVPGKYDLYFIFICYFIFKIINFIEDEPEIMHHPKSCYTKRRIDYSAKLYRTLLQDELNDRIIMNNNNNNENETMISENLGMNDNLNANFSKSNSN
jgi:serine/threonine protein kinase